MTNSLFKAMEIVFPVFLMLSIGVFCRKLRFVDDRSIYDINKLIFNIFLSILIFINIYGSDKKHLFSWENWILVAITYTVTILSVLISEFYFKKRCSAIDSSISAVITQGIFRSNGVIFALPIITALCGNKNLDSISLLILAGSPLHNILAVIVLSKINTAEPNIQGTLKKLAKNPMIIASLIALIFFFFDIPIPNLLYISLQDFTKATTPLSFLILGASLKLSSFKQHFKILSFVAFLRLILVPGISFIIAISFGIHGSHLAALIGLMAAPTAVSSFTMAKAYGGNSELAAEIVSSTTFVSAVTVFAWIALLDYLMLV